MPHNNSNSDRAGRRTLNTLLLASVATWLAACAAPAPPPAPAPAPVPAITRAQALQALGFRATDAGWEFSLNGKMLFDSDSDRLDAESQSTADRLGRELAMLGVDTVRVEGHTDNLGSAAYNQSLSRRRAQAVAQALAGAGLQGARFEVRGLGKAYPVARNDTAELRLQNRRVSVIVPAQ